VLNEHDRLAATIDEIAAIIESERRNPDRPDVGLRTEAL
jgi:hypothetical protein